MQSIFNAYDVTIIVTFRKNKIMGFGGMQSAARRNIIVNKPAM